MLYRRGRIWWFKFRVGGRVYRETTPHRPSHPAEPDSRQCAPDLGAAVSSAPTASCDCSSHLRQRLARAVAVVPASLDASAVTATRT